MLIVSRFVEGPALMYIYIYICIHIDLVLFR